MGDLEASQMELLQVPMVSYRDVIAVREGNPFESRLDLDCCQSITVRIVLN